MKSLILVLAIIIMTTNTLNAQIDYYHDYPNEVTISTEDGVVTYKYSISKLYNNANKFTGIKNVFTDGSTESRLGKQFDKPEDQMDVVNKIVYDNLSEEQRKMIIDKYFSIDFYFDSQTGRVVDVVFGLIDKEANYLPPEFYYKVEKECKKVVSITPTSFGKRLNYIFGGYGFEVKPPSEFVRTY